MAAGRDAAKHAGTLYRKSFGSLRHPVREIEAEAEHLLEIEREGGSEATPLIAIIAIMGIIFFLTPIVLPILGLAFARVLPRRLAPGQSVSTLGSIRVRAAAAYESAVSVSARGTPAAA